MSYKPRAFVCLDGEINTIPVTEHGFTTVHAVAGIGAPEVFFKSLERCGIRVIPHIFPDHHRYTISNLTFNDVLPIIMTEKDAVKCRHFSIPNMWYLEVETSVSPEFESAFLKRVKGLLYGKKII